MKRFFLLLFAYCIFCLNAIGAEPHLFKLPNGHTIIIEELPQNKVVTVDTWVKTGSINENDKNNGISHFLEHLMFKGTKNHKAGEFEKLLDKKGALYNAATSKDFTHFYITTSSDNLKEAMDLHFDMLLNPAFPKDEIEKEKKVVIEEISRSNDDPGTTLYKNFTQMLIKNHPYRYETIGKKEIIESTTRDDITTYYNKFYVPQNFVTVIAGNVKSKDILAIINDEFKSKTFAPYKKITYKKEPAPRSPQEKIARGDYSTGYLLMGFSGVDFANQKDNMALDVASMVLGDGRSSRLYQNIKEKQNLATSISSSHSSSKDMSVFYVSANFEPQSYDKLKQSINSEIARLRTENITEAEFQKAVNMVERDFIYANESTEDITTSIGYTMTIGDKLEYYTRYLCELKKLTPDDVRKAANKYLDPNKVVISALLPEKAEKPVSNIAPKAIYKKSLNNGVTMISENTDANEVISLSIFVKGGKFVEEKPGLTAVLSGTLMKGTKNRTSFEIAQELENNGIIISPSANSDYFEIDMKTTTKDFNKAFCILKDVLNNASFNQSDVEKTKADILEQIKKAQDYPKTRLFDNMIKDLFPQGPYGYTSALLSKTVPTVTKADVENYYQNIFIPQNMTISVVGNLKDIDIERELAGLINRSQGKIVDNKVFITPFKPLERNLLTKETMDNQASWVAMAYKAPGISDGFDEFATLKVINAILGNGMSSRLFKDMREKQGLAYEISSSYPTMLDNSYFMMYIGTNPKNVETVQKEFLKQIERLKTEPLNEQELNDVKSSMKGLLVLMQETNGQRAEMRGRFELLNNNYDFVNNYQKAIDKVTSSDIITVARKYFSKPYVISLIETKK